MNTVQRICPECGASAPVDSRYCPRCGVDAQAELSIKTTSLVPAAVVRAALPVLAGAATIVVRMGWKLLMSRLAASTTQASPRAPATPLQRTTQSLAPAQRQGRRVRIRSTWAVGDGNGIWRQGAAEHIIEFDE